jgi:hypothetical protein
VSRLLTESEELLLPDLIVAEGVHVLESFYEVPRAEVARLVRAIVVDNGQRQGLPDA